MSAAPHKPLITEELLHRAWRDVRRPGWGSFDDAMADPVHAALVRARAAALAHAAQGPPPAPPRPTPTRPWPPLHQLTRQPARTDAKRAAAGDTDSSFNDDEDTP